LLVAQHKIGVLLAAIWVVFPKLDFKSHLKIGTFARISSTNFWHALKESSWKLDLCLGDPLQAYPSVSPAGSSLLPKEFVRRQAYSSLAVPTVPESPSGSH